MKKLSRKKRKKLNEEKFKHEQKINIFLSRYRSAVEAKKKHKQYVCFHNVTVNGIESSTRNNESGICDICGSTDIDPIYISDGKTKKIDKKELLYFSKENLEKYILYEAKELSGLINTYTKISVEDNKYKNAYKLESSKEKYRVSYIIAPRNYLEQLIDISSVRSFSETLSDMIEKKKMKNTEVYKRANVDAKLFSKIINDKSYHPGKSTVLAFAVAMKLDLSETEQFLMEAGYAFSPNILSDIIVKYYIETKHYDIDDINAALFEYNQKLLGSSVRK
ncbi:MAG: hypothetical protein IJA12_06250 [Oscillospiraceae bacterium]|nr:hypothetical protein [Oscillospiraceae bacterium]